MDYFEKIEKNPYEDLAWNIPERRQGSVNVIGGNAGNFRAEAKIAEFLAGKYPLEKVGLVLPGALKGKLPELPNLEFLPATETGSFAESEGLVTAINSADYSLLLGDLTKNAVTGRAVASACGNSEKPLLITRDSVDVMAENMTNLLLMNENLALMASVAQLQKLLRAVYYPKMLMMSQSLVQVSEVLHKFTLSYPVALVTLHNGQILVAKDGMVKAVPLEAAGCAPIMFWQGEVAAKIVTFNLYNPHNFIPATIASLMV